MKTALDSFDAMLARWREDREPPSYRDLVVLREAMAAATGAAAQAAMRTLHGLGYTYEGGEQWKPPLGRPHGVTRFIERMRSRGLRLTDFDADNGGADIPPVTIDYTNHRGERALRNIKPLGIRFASTEHHPTAQWLLDAHDIDKDARRTFAMRDIHAWGGAAIMRAPAPGPMQAYSDAEKGILARDDAKSLRQAVSAGYSAQSAMLRPLLEGIAKRLELGWYAAPPGVATLHVDASAAEIDAAVRGKLIELGWLPPGAHVVKWRDKQDMAWVYTADGAAQVLKRLFDEWPGGLEEVEAAMKAARATAGAPPTFYYRGPLADQPGAWIEWDGSQLRDANGRYMPEMWPQCPVNRDAKIRVRFRDGEKRQVDEPYLMRWAWTRPYVSAADIVAYQVIDDGIPF